MFPRAVGGHDLVTAARVGGRKTLTEFEAKTLLAGIGVAVPRGGVARSEDEAEDLAHRLSVPTVLKVVCPGITHKSELGGVLFPVSPDAVRGGYRQLLEQVRARRPEAPVEGVLVEEFISGGVECILSFRRAGAFGPVVMFGLGGVFTEVLQDVSFRLVPFDPEDAAELLREIQGTRCLDGFRGRPAVDRDALVQTILAVASIGQDAALQAITEVEINPLLACPDRSIALDAVVTLEVDG